MNTEQFHELARQVAAHLGWNFDEDTADWYVRLKHPQMAGMALQLKQRNGRLVISGVYINDLTHGYFGPSHDSEPRITVSATREAASIAQDIERRLLPQYCSEYEKYRLRFEEARQDLAERQDALRQLAAALGCREQLEKELTENPNCYTCSARVGKTHVKISWHSKDGRIEIRWADLPIAIAVARAINQQNDRTREALARRQQNDALQAVLDPYDEDEAWAEYEDGHGREV